MNKIGEFMTSGILQDYCLGLLNHEDERRVEAMCHAYPQVYLELQSLRQALEQYTGSHEIWRRTALRKAVWEAVKKLWEEKP
jgi:hypothetical protein